ncbi:hypothetical protein GPJ59_02190 [Streptomyces bambusae]|uniref:Zf-HC2 domain-containing protein n=1 Tax=Streptomyces bambusae TaxID=1550616 RepID=A0ABS6YZ23_9ACTN|nr:hypothetical protein [Streptomyces bambusae]
MRHPDVSEISDLTEGLLPPSRTSEIRRHLDDCALCADVRASLEEIRSLLGTLPGPPRVPADIAGRIDAALAAEALLDATTPAPDSTAPGPAPADEPARDVSRETVAATAGRSHTPFRPAGRPRGATGPGRGRRRAVLAGLMATAALGIGIFLFQQPWSEQQARPSRDSAASSLSRPPDGTTFSEAGLEGEVHQLLGSAQQNRSLSSTDAPPGLAPAEREGASLPDCVQRGTGRTEAPLATERGTFDGTNVYLVVLPHPGDPDRVDAYLVDSACESSPSAGPGKVLLNTDYSRR